MVWALTPSNLRLAVIIMGLLGRIRRATLAGPLLAATAAQAVSKSVVWEGEGPMLSHVKELDIKFCSSQWIPPKTVSSGWCALHRVPAGTSQVTGLRCSSLKVRRWRLQINRRTSQS